jgi:glycosyltransferase involved in cell wall biosynthesis
VTFAPSLSVVIASCGRPSLTATIDSILGQGHEVEVLVDINHDIPWGNAARQRTMLRARGSHLLFMDDDDLYAPGAFEAIVRAAAENPARVHMFRMARPEGLDDIWRTPTLQEGNVSTQMVVVPNVAHKLGKWGDRYEGDWDFISGTVSLLGAPVWHQDVIAIYGRGRIPDS